MSGTMTFYTRALVSYLVLLGLLVAGMIFLVRRLHAEAEEEVATLRARENEITLAERLRWSGEAIVSAGRGYLISGDPKLLARHRAGETQFDQTLHALEPYAAASREGSLAAVKVAARAFAEEQRKLMRVRTADPEVKEIIQLFEAQLLPRQLALGNALDALVQRRHADLGVTYELRRKTSSDAVRWATIFVALLALFSGATAVLFATQLARAYASERRAVSLRDDLMGIVAHDLRNPLNTIALSAALLSRTGDPDAIRKYTGAISRLTQRMDGLIRTMLDAATLEAGRLLVTPAPLAASALLAEATEILKSLVAERGISADTIDGGVEGLWVLADRDRILQVFSNLIGNAVKFTPEGGRITLLAYPEVKEGRVRFGVADTGAGISAEHLPHLFERFWKHESGGQKGTGLGLFIARGIVEGHGGSIRAESQPGRGTTFWFTLRMAPGH